MRSALDRLCLSLGHRQDLLPPAHDPIGLGKESVTAEIHSIAAVIDRLGNSAHLSVGLDDDGRDIGPPQEFEGGRQAGRPRAGYDCNFLLLVAGRHGRCFQAARRRTKRNWRRARKIPNKGKAGGPALGNEVVHAQDPYAKENGRGVDRNPDHPDTREASELHARVLEPAILEYQSDRQHIRDEQTDRKDAVAAATYHQER